MRERRGALSPREFAASVRRAAREIGEHVSCDARYVARVESGEIRRPNYASERVFRHMFLGATLADLGFTPRGESRRAALLPAPRNEENDDVQRRTFLAGGPLAVVTALSWDSPAEAQSFPIVRAHGTAPSAVVPGSGAAVPDPGTLPLPNARVGLREVHQVEEAVRQIRLLDDVHGTDTLFERAGHTLRSAHQLLNCGTYGAQVEQRLQASAGELAISVGWLAHDSGEAGRGPLPVRRGAGHGPDGGRRRAGGARLLQHRLPGPGRRPPPRGRPRRAGRAERGGGSRVTPAPGSAGTAGGRRLGTPRDGGSSRKALGEARSAFEQGTSEADPEVMPFFNEAEMARLTAQCWAALGEFEPAADWVEQTVALQSAHFVRNRTLYTAELAHDQLGRGALAKAVRTGSSAVALPARGRSTRIRGMVSAMAEPMRQHRAVPEVSDFMEQYHVAIVS
jgi:hypothetical protein